MEHWQRIVDVVTPHLQPAEAVQAAVRVIIPVGAPGQSSNKKPDGQGDRFATAYVYRLDLPADAKNWAWSKNGWLVLTAQQLAFVGLSAWTMSGKPGKFVGAEPRAGATLRWVDASVRPGETRAARVFHVTTGDGHWLVFQCPLLDRKGNDVSAETGAHQFVSAFGDAAEQLPSWEDLISG